MNKPDYGSVAVVIPCFNVKNFILNVIATIPKSIGKIYVIDDACPDHTGLYVQTQCLDNRVKVLFNQVNQGVGGAVMQGYRQALADGCFIVVKIDGDGQMDGAKIPQFVDPIFAGEADYTKGNRFYNPETLGHMPGIRIFGNAVLSFMTKLSSGYWDSFDPTNGFTAISAPVLRQLPLDKIHPRYFFESDILFRLNIIRAVLVDIPLEAIYGEEKSNLVIRSNIGPFMKGNIRNFCKRIFYNYYLRNFSLASLELLFGLLLMVFGIVYGSRFWLYSILEDHPATAGSVMVAALPIIMGFQLLMSFLNYDINMVPRRPITKILVS